ncbi:MAG TPA: hypothetical protein VGM78_06075 [Ilumatobacteraceae bacterium]
MEPEAWTTRAVNLPEHARNAIHTDAGAHAAGFPRALVAGVTTYAYLTHPIVAAWGIDWVRSGGGEVRFRHPVFEDDLLRCEPAIADDAVTVRGLVGDGEARASLRAVRVGGPPPEAPAGERAITRTVQLSGEWSDYGVRAGDDLALYHDEGIVHPAVWPALANQVVHAEVASGAWIHTRSVVRHHGVAASSSVAMVTATVVDRFASRSGQRAVLDVRIEVDGVLVASLEHEAIVRLPPLP